MLKTVGLSRCRFRLDFDFPFPSPPWAQGNQGGGGTPQGRLALEISKTMTSVDLLTNCTGQELSVGVLRECNRLTVAVQLTITMVSYGTDTNKKCPFPWVSRPLSITLFLGQLGPPESSSQTHVDRFSRFA